MSQAKGKQPNTGALGELTGVFLGDTGCLFAPYETDAFGMRRRSLKEDGLKLSLELARMAYTLDVGPWMRAGWTDVSVQVDNRLTTGLRAREDDHFADRLAAAIGGLRLTRARMAAKERLNPLAQATGALRQRAESDTIKAVVMARPTGDGRFLLAVGFMGTGKRFYDWFSNFRIGTEGGFHKGFYQLTQTFIRNEEQILFPDTAEALGLARLSLKDILSEMRQAGSRFSLWIAGHSQGAAVMQVYCDRLLRETGLNPELVFGCGFASPTAAADNAAADGAAYPLYHVLNADDLVPRMGSLKHFGMCLEYAPDAKFRDLAYGWGKSADERAARRDAQRLTQYVTDTPSFLTAFTALLSVICEEKTDEAIFGGSEGLLSVAPIEKAVSFAGRKAKETLCGMIAYMRKTYAEIRGSAMDGAEVAFLMEEFRPIVKAAPPKRVFSALFELLYPPHSLYNDDGNYAYLRIVNEHRRELKSFLWEDDHAAPPRRRYAKGYYTFGNTRRIRRARSAVRRPPSRRRAIQGRR